MNNHTARLSVLFLALAALPLVSAKPVSARMPGADLSVSLAPLAVSSSSYQYRITLANSGPESAAAIRVTVPLQKGEQAYVSHLVAPPGGCFSSGSEITCEFASIDSGASAAIDVNVYSVGGRNGWVRVSAAAESGTPDMHKSDNRARMAVELK